MKVGSNPGCLRPCWSPLRTLRGPFKNLAGAQKTPRMFFKHPADVLFRFQLQRPLGSAAPLRGPASPCRSFRSQQGVYPPVPCFSSDRAALLGLRPRRLAIRLQLRSLLVGKGKDNEPTPLHTRRNQGDFSRLIQASHLGLIMRIVWRLSPRPSSAGWTGAEHPAEWQGFSKRQARTLSVVG